jgi:hypothetical protein
MEPLDQQEQWRQLMDTYRQMSEHELCRVADDAFDLGAQLRMAHRGVK